VAIRSSAALAAAAFLAGCGEEAEAPPPPAEAVQAAAQPQGPPACEERRFEESRFTACRYDPKRHRLELIGEDEAGPLRSFARLEQHLGTRAETLLFAMNAGMYDEEGRPIGLYVADGKQIRSINLNDGPGNFHMKPNGVFTVDAQGRAAVIPSDRFAAVKANPHWANQSGPMLVIAGKIHPQFAADGPSRHVRNGVGTDGSGAAWFAISEDVVSLGRFARFFRDELGAHDALFLDGAVSSLWDAPAGRQDGYSELGPLVAVFRR
jgi:uncharacterized protein YigE (DUF2233 family)